MEGDGYACLDGTLLSDGKPEMLPKLVAFDPPDPLEWTQYSTGGGYTHDPVSEAEALTPAIYGKTWRTWKGALYASPESYAAGDKPVGALIWGTKYRFPSAVDTEKGTVLVRDDGKAAPVEDVFLYPIDRFQGRDLTVDPLPAGYVQGWAIEYDDEMPVFATAEPAADAVPDKMIAYHTPLLVDPTPVDAAGKWFRIKDALGPGQDGYAKEDKNIPTFRRWDPPVRPEAIGADERWIDVDIQQQVLTVMQGDSAAYVTMVSSGEELATPVGIFRVFDKMAAADMQGRVDATYDPYYVEGVPWTMHFYPRYALHGAYWHWGFGHRASHGCVNLAPKDARYIYDHIGPTMYPGWIESYETEADPGTTVRVRNGAITVRDRRTSL